MSAIDLETYLAGLAEPRRAKFLLLRPLLEPILEYLLDPHVSEVFILGETDIRVRRAGRDQHTAKRFPQGDLELLIRQIGTFSNQSIGWHTERGETPILEGNLPDGSRCSGTLAGINVDGACLTIRKHGKRLLTPEDLLAKGTLTESQLADLKAAVAARKHILISGGTDTGKTTLLNVLSNFIERDRRILVVEDTPELQIQGNHVVRFQTAPQAGVDFLALLRLCMRQTGDHIIFGEIRGAEAWPYILALNSGHPGSMTTIHANSPAEALQKFADYCLLANLPNVPAPMLRSQVNKAFQLVIQLSRCSGGRKIVEAITGSREIKFRKRQTVNPLHR